MMLFKNYEYFLTIANTCNISRAAEELYIAQPSLSKYLIHLEERLGTVLFDRSVSPLRLTLAGEKYRQYVLNIAEKERALQMELKEINQGERAVLRVGIAIWRCSILMPQFLPAFSQRHPQIEIQVMEASGDDCERALERGNLDFILINLTKVNPAFEYQTIMNEKILLVANNALPLVQEHLKRPPAENGYRHFDLNLLNGEYLILNKPGQHIEQIVSLLLKKYRIAPGHTWVSASTTTILNMVASGPYFAFVPEAAKKRAFPPDNITFFTVDDPILTWAFAAA